MTSIKDHLYKHEQRVVHSQFGEGKIISPITKVQVRTTGKRLIKNTYIVHFLEHGPRTVHEKDLKKWEPPIRRKQRGSNV